MRWTGTWAIRVRNRLVIPAPLSIDLYLMAIMYLKTSVRQTKNTVIIETAKRCVEVWDKEELEEN